MKEKWYDRGNGKRLLRAVIAFIYVATFICCCLKSMNCLGTIEESDNFPGQVIKLPQFKRLFFFWE